jgi:dinuclear metal center YbgI/SA1388 family protein
MITLQSICSFLEQFAPAVLAEHWDNVGLLAGDRTSEVHSVMTCLTITPESVAEAIADGADLVVAHHPLPFHALKRITTDQLPGQLLWQLITHRVAIFSPHTSYDSAAEGINQQLAEGLGLEAIQPLVARDESDPPGGTGRWGRLPTPGSLRALAQRLKHFLHIERLQAVGPLDRQLQQVAVACGAAGSLLPAAREANCDALVLGETNLHTCLQAEAAGVALLLPGHYASERFAVQRLAEVLGGQFPALNCWASRRERDPLQWL